LAARAVPAATPSLETVIFSVVFWSLARVPEPGVTVSQSADSAVTVYGVAEPRLVSSIVRVLLASAGITTASSATEAATRPVTSAVSTGVSVPGTTVTDWVKVP
jgi:hypothetical protein